MDELVARISEATGLDPAVSRNAAIIIMKFLLNESSSDKAGDLIDAIPGAREAIESSSIGGSSGVMGAFNDLTAAGLGMGDVQGAARAFGDVAREKAGAETVNEVVASVPGLSQFV